MNKQTIFLDKGRAWCSTREYSASEVKEKLIKAKCPESLIAVIIDSLIHEKFIDELRLSKAYIHDKTLFNHWGKVKIRMMLRRKRINEKTIDQAFNETVLENTNEIIHALITEKWKNIKGKSFADKKIKLMRYLISKGYEYEEVIETTNFIKEDTEPDSFNF